MLVPWVVPGISMTEMTGYLLQVVLRPRHAPSLENGQWPGFKRLAHSCRVRILT